MLEIFYGFGFKCYASDEELKHFILNHQKTISRLKKGKELVNYTNKCSPDEFNPKEDFFDWENRLTGDFGVYGVVADVMSLETGINFEFRSGNADDEDDDDVIIFPEGYPWHFNEKEKNVTLRDISDICRTYISELNPDLFCEDIRKEIWMWD